MHFLLIIFSVLNSLPLLAALIDPSYTPVAWDRGILFPATREEVPLENILTFESERGEDKKLTARTWVPPVMDLFLNHLMEENFPTNFDDFKNAQKQQLQNWLNNLPFRETRVTNLAVGKIHQETNIFKYSWTDDKDVSVMDGRKGIKSTLETPYKPQLLLLQHGYIGKAEARSSATMIGRRAALTAAHCVYSKENKWGRDFRVYPAVYRSDGKKSHNTIQLPIITTPNKEDDVYTPFGYYPVKQIYVPQGWIDSINLPDNDPKKLFYDFALLLFDEDIGDDTGYLGMAAVTNRDLTLPHPLLKHGIHIGGYPATLGIDGETVEGKNHQPKQNYPAHFSSRKNVNIGYEYRGDTHDV